MTNHDVTVATPSDDTSGERPRQQHAEMTRWHGLSTSARTTAEPA